MKKNMERYSKLEFRDPGTVDLGPFFLILLRSGPDLQVLVLDKCDHGLFVAIIILAASGAVFIIECSIGAKTTLFTPIVNHEITCA